ncbi:MAG: hypothetical protein IT452_03735 [Planctomycetia bacterium]|nr:hypothetical protein [Planctomycetia bacterium]
MTNSPAWAVRLDAARASAGAALRLVPGIEACEAGGHVWLRGPEGGEELALALRRLPGADRYEVLPGGALRVPGKRVPAGALPAGPWVAAADWAAAEPQAGALPAELTQRVKARVEPAAEERPANLLRVPLAAFAAWAESAPAVRLRGLAFAASEDEALVRGEPPPPLPGRAYAEAGGIAVPCGRALVPAAGAAAWRERLGLAEGDLALFDDDGTFERIPAAAFVRASRSAARATGGHA